MEIFFHTANGDGDEEEKKSVFVKIPLTGEAGKNFKQVISCNCNHSKNSERDSLYIHINFL